MGQMRMRTKRKTKSLFQRIVRKTLHKPEQLTVSQWAEKYRILDESSALPGRWSNTVTPYLVKIMDAFNDPYIERINFCKPTQVGGTEAMVNMLGWIISQNPSPSMIVYPSDDLAKDISNDKLKPAIRKSTILRDRFYEDQSKELKLRFRGMILYLRGSNSPGKLASRSIKYLFFDEIDKMGGASKKEASPYNLALERTRTYKYGKKIYTCSTPTLKTNYVWNLHMEAEVQYHYFLPCPHCGEFIELKFACIDFIKDDEKKLTVRERASTAKYYCQECGCEIKDKQKPEMLQRGEWRDVKKTCVGRPKNVSFWLNSLYSIFVSWVDVATEWLKSKDDPDQLQNFINSWLAEPWEDTKLKTNSETVMERQTPVEEFMVPEWAEILTGGVDVQENCLYWVIRAWGPHVTSQNIAHGQADSFQHVEEVMNLEYPKEDGTKCIVNLALIDSGNDTDSVYDFCATNSEWAYPCKGSSNTMASTFKMSQINKVGSSATGMSLIIVDTGKYKDMIAGRMQRVNGVGSWMVHKDCDMEYANQVTSEHKINAKTGNKSRQIWALKNSHADNHYLDCEVYAFAAADMLGVRSLHLDRSEEKKAEPVEQEEQQNNWLDTDKNWLGDNYG